MKSKQAVRVEVQARKKRGYEWNQKKRKICLVEKRGYGDLGQEEVENIGSVPSALCELRGAVHRCDNRYSEHSFRFNQIGAMVTQEVGEAHTINSCKRCYNEMLVRQGKQQVKAAEWRQCRAASFSWQAMEGFRDGTIYARDVGKFHRCYKRDAGRNTRSAATGVPFKEGLEQTEKHSEWVLVALKKLAIRLLWKSSPAWASHKTSCEKKKPMS